MNSTINIHPIERKASALESAQEAIAYGTEEQELIAAAREIQPLLRRNAPLGEAQRSMTDEVLQVLDKLGMFSLLTPRRWGGRETQTRDAWARIESLPKGGRRATDAD